MDDSLLIKGEDNRFFIEITNKGLSDAKFLEIEIGLGQYELLTTRNHYIGDIDSDDFDSVRINAFFNKNVGSVVNMPVTVTYRDDLNQEYIDTRNINLKVYNEGRAVELGLVEKSVGGNYVIGIFLIIVLYLIYRRLKKKSLGKRVNK